METNSFELIQKLKEIDPDLIVIQVKEKFGGLRFYTGPSDTDGVMELIDGAEAQCAITCEYCGSTENVEARQEHGWIKTLCLKCNRNRYNVDEMAQYDI
jgi:hypothetical protein